MREGGRASYSYSYGAGRGPLFEERRRNFDFIAAARRHSIRLAPACSILRDGGGDRNDQQLSRGVEEEGWGGGGTRTLTGRDGWMLQVFILRLEVEPNVFFSPQQSAPQPNES